jgi:P27 family predicted phage terminase small subunit
MAGRRPKTDAQRTLEGNPGRRPMRKTPKPDGQAKCPDWMGDIAREEWKRLQSSMQLLGLLSTVDQQCFAAYCDSYERYVTARQQVATEGMTFRTTSGQVKKHPAVGIMREAMIEMRKFAIEYGLTPASRTKVAAAHVQQPQLPGMPPKPDMPSAADSDDRFFGAGPSTH